MRDFSNETPVNSPVNWLRLAPALLNGHLIPSVRTVMTDSANHTAQTLLDAGMQRVAVPQDAGERVDFVAKWVQRNQRRVAAGLPISVLVLALSAAEAQAQEELVSLAAQEGVEGVTRLANGDVQVTYTNGNVVVLAENSVVISATGEVLVTVAVAEGAALSAGVAIAGGMGAIGAAGLGAAGLLASLSDESATPTTSGGSVAPDSGVGGRIIDGYIAGATVFRDLNANRILDAGEPNVTSDATGNFTGLTGTGGVIVSVGGTDISTGKAFTGIMTAPAGATVVTPLTTLVQAMMEADPALSVADANLAVVRAFGISDVRVEVPDGDESVLVPQNLLTFDPTTNFGGLDVFAAGAKVAAIMLVAAAAAGDTPAEQAAAVRAVALSLATQIAQNPTPPGGPLTQAAILDALDDALGDDDTNVDKTELLGTILNAIEDAEQNEGTFSQVIGAIEDVQTYVQGELLVNIESGTIPAGPELVGGLANAVSPRPVISSFPRFFTLSEVVLEEKPLQFNGSGRPGSVVTVTFGGLTSDDIPVDTQGRWTFTLTADDLAKVIEGTPVETGPFAGEAFAMQAVAKETTGTVTITSPVTTIGTFVVDLTAPDSPVITGQIAGDGIININEANSAVRVQGTVDADVDRVEYWINDGPRQTTFVMSTTTSTGSERIFEFFLSANAQNGALALPTSDAPFTLNIVSIDNGRNRSEVTSVTLNIDREGPTSAPTLNSVNYDDVINAEMAADGVEVSGLVSLAAPSNQDSSETFRLTFDGLNFIPVVNDGFGNYTATLNADNLPEDDGTYTLRAQRVDTAGNISEAGQVIRIDRTPPDAPTLNPLSDNRLNATEDLIITGTAEHGSTIIVRINGQQVDPAPVEDGTFAVTVPAQALSIARLTDGQITASVTATDMYGNTSTAATTTFTYDGTAPAAATLDTESLVFNSAQTEQGLVFTGKAEANAAVSFQLLTEISDFATGVVVDGTANEFGDFRITFARDDVFSGNFTLRTLVTDAAGNVTTKDFQNVVIDINGPEAPVIVDGVSGDNFINKSEADSGVTIRGTAQASTETAVNQIRVSIGNSVLNTDVDTDGNFEVTFGKDTLPTRDGTYSATAWVVDAAGNRGPDATAQSVIIDRTPPAAPIVQNTEEVSFLNAADLTNGVTIYGTALGASLVVVNFGGNVVRGTPMPETGAFGITIRPNTELNQGPAEIIIDAYDAAGNVTSTVINTTIDLTPPAAAVISSVTVTDGIVTVTGTVPDETGAVLTLQLQPKQGGASETFTATIEGTSFSFTTTTALADGNYFMITRLADQAGNVTLGSPFPVSVGVPPEPTATEIYATALTLEDMREAVAMLIEDAPVKFQGITPEMLPTLAADLLMQRGGTYSISFTGEVFDALGNPTAVVTDNPTGTDVSGTFHIPLDLIDLVDDQLESDTNPYGVFEFSITLPQGLTNTFTGANALNLPTDVTNLRMDVVATERAALPDDQALIAILGQTAASKIITAFTESNGAPVNFTYLAIWAPGATGEGPTLSGNDLTLTFSQLGVVGLNAFFTNAADTFSVMTNTQYGFAPGGVVGDQLLATTSLSVDFTPTTTVTEEELGDLLLDAAALRTAVTNVIEAANTNKLTLQLLETLADIAGPTNGEAANALRLLAGEQLQAADVDRLLAFLVQPILDQTNALADYNNGLKFAATTLTEILDNVTLFPPSLLQGPQVFFNANNPEGLVFNNTLVDVGGDVRELASAGAAPIEMLRLDLTNSDLAWQITPGGNVVVAAFIDGPQTVPQDVILVYAPDGSLKSWVINAGDTSNSFYVNTTLADANGVVFSMINAASGLAEGDTAFTTYHVPLALFDTITGLYSPDELFPDATTLLTFDVPTGGGGFDYNPTSAIELLEFTEGYELGRMLIQVENAEGDGIQTLLYTEGSPSTLDALPAYVYDYSVRVDGPTPLGLLLETNSIDTNGPADGGVVSQNGVYYFDLDLGRITSVQTMGTDDAQDALFGQGANDIIIPLGVTGSTTAERIDLPFPGFAPVSGVETIVVDLEDVFKGNKIALYGFDLAQDKIAFFESDLFVPAKGYNAIHVTVETPSSFTLDDVLASAGFGFVTSLTFFAVDDGDNTILFATDGTRSGEVAWLNGVDLTTDGQPSQNLLVTPFAIEDLLVPLPT